MVPSRVLTLSRWPLTPNGKIDRARLPLPVVESAAIACHCLKPVEEIISGIWSDVLRRDVIGVDENFFELGGHSLMATQVMSRLRETFGVEIGLRVLFE